MPPENPTDVAADISFRRNPREFPWATIPYWFAAIAGLTYATGFLVEFTFQHSLGITVSLDIFKAKYIYIGLQCLQFPVVLTFLLLGFWRAKTKQWKIENEIKVTKLKYTDLLAQSQKTKGIDETTTNELNNLKLTFEQLEGDDFRVVTSFIVAMAGLLLVFYLTTTFSRPKDWPEMQLPVAVLSVCITILMALVRAIERPIESIIGRPFGLAARAALLIPEYIAIAIICRSPIQLFGACLLDGGYFYLLFVGLAFLMLFFLQWFLPKFAKYRRAGALFAMNLSITLSFLYLSTLAYAYHIYPYLPISRGGGDYSADPRACLVTFTNDSIASIPLELVDGDSLRSHPLTVLEDTADAIFVTLEHTQAERERWRLVGVMNKPKAIYSLKKESIVNITYQDVANILPARPRPGIAPVPTPSTIAAPPNVQSPQVALPSPTASPTIVQPPKTTVSPSASPTATSRHHKAKKSRPRS